MVVLPRLFVQAQLLLIALITEIYETVTYCGVIFIWNVLNKIY